MLSIWRRRRYTDSTSPCCDQLVFSRVNSFVSAVKNIYTVYTIKSSVGDLKTIDNGIEVTITDDRGKHLLSVNTFLAYSQK